MSDWDYEPECPHCGAKQTDLWELELRGDGDQTETDCGACATPIKVTMSVSVEYLAEPVDTSTVKP